MFFDNYDITLV